jgi:hypothetical protein
MERMMLCADAANSPGLITALPNPFRHSDCDPINLTENIRQPDYSRRQDKLTLIDLMPF